MKSALPLLVSPGLVRELLADNKTHTRRLQNLQMVNDQPDDWQFVGFSDDERPTALFRHYQGYMERVKCPYGKTGNYLWVRERFCIESNLGIEDESLYPPPHNDGRPLQRFECEVNGDYWEQPHYFATDPTPELAYDDTDEPTVHWKPSIHMPRWVSRITLYLREIRLERLQDISESDAQAEGALKCSAEDNAGEKIYCLDPQNGSYRTGFKGLWQQINGPASWDANPWLWVLVFDVIKKNVDEVLAEISGEQPIKYQQSA